LLLLWTYGDADRKFSYLTIANIANNCPWYPSTDIPVFICIVQQCLTIHFPILQLAARNLSAIWQRHYYPHNYEITAFEAYFDMYMLTGQPLYLSAVEGAWEMMRNNWIHVGGSIAINEMQLYPPSSYYLTPQHPTGELCGSSFWIRLNQRFHRLRPTEVRQSLHGNSSFCLSCGVFVLWRVCLVACRTAACSHGSL